MSKRKSFDSERQRRRQAAILFERGLSRAAVARELGVSRTAASRWYRRWRTGGAAALAGPDRSGRKCRITNEALAPLDAILTAGPSAYGLEGNHWTLDGVAKVIKKEFGIEYHLTHVQKILQALGWFYAPRGRPRRGSKTGRGSFAWRKRKCRRRRRRTPVGSN